MGAALMAVLERQRHEDKTCNQCEFMADGARSVMGGWTSLPYSTRPPLLLLLRAAYLHSSRVRVAENGRTSIQVAVQCHPHILFVLYEAASACSMGSTH
jgi:hypothetical protein